jgi:hypothetical protein
LLLYLHSICQHLHSIWCCIAIILVNVPPFHLLMYKVVQI